MSPRPLLARAIAVLLVGGLAGCPPPCSQICRKILNDCDLDTERVSFDECTASCNAQGQLYATWNNDHLSQLFEEQRRCIGRSSCEELAKGACYDGFEELYSFDPDKVIPGGTSTGSE